MQGPPGAGNLSQCVHSSMDYAESASMPETVSSLNTAVNIIAESIFCFTVDIVTVISGIASYEALGHVSPPLKFKKKYWHNGPSTVYSSVGGIKGT